MYKEALENNSFIDSNAGVVLSPEQKAIWDEMFFCRAEMEEIFLGNTLISGINELDLESLYTIAFYLLVKVYNYENPLSICFNDLFSMNIDSDILGVAQNNHLDDIWGELLQLINVHAYNIFVLNVILQNVSYPSITPVGISELAIKLLDIKSDDNVAELCCGMGYVINQIKECCPSAKTTGYDVDSKCIAVAKAQNEFSENKTSFIKCDVFELADKESVALKYDKIFSNYPFGQRLRDLKDGKEYLETLTRKIPSMSKATSSDWLYNMLMTEMLTENGKAIGIMTNGSTWNMIDASIRQYFVENGLIECVIALPSKLFNNTAIATSMVIFSHGNNGVRLVDASECFTAGRRVNEIADNNIDSIVSLITNDSEKSFFVETKKLRENDYVLNTSRYIVGAESIKEGIPFESVIKRITRGAPLNANQLDKLSSQIPTDMQYITLSNIQNGLIDNTLPYLNRIDKKNEKYCLTNQCLIMSKNGKPYKVAVVELKEGQRIMANGNLYIIELDIEKVNPYYVAAFFSSERGIAVLSSITVGATIPNIGVEQLKKIIIPLPDIEEQNRIGNIYQETRDEIKMLQLKLEKARNRFMHIFEEEV